MGMMLVQYYHQALGFEGWRIHQNLYTSPKAEHYGLLKLSTLSWLDTFHSWMGMTLKAPYNGFWVKGLMAEEDGIPSFAHLQEGPIIIGILSPSVDQNQQLTDKKIPPHLDNIKDGTHFIMNSYVFKLCILGKQTASPLIYLKEKRVALCIDGWVPCFSVSNCRRSNLCVLLLVLAGFFHHDCGFSSCSSMLFSLVSVLSWDARYKK